MNKVIRATVTQKGQITIPKEFRDALGIEKYGQVSLTREGNVIKLSNLKDLSEMAGFLSNRKYKNKGIDPVKARDYMSKNYKR